MHRSNTPASAPAAAAATAPRGVLLRGLPGANAYAALEAYTAESAAGQPAPSPLTAFVDLSATVGQVNAALNSISARIVNMQPRRQAVAIEVAAGPGMLPAREVAARLVASRAFQWVQGQGLPAAPFALATDPAAPEPVDDHAPPP